MSNTTTMFGTTADAANGEEKIIPTANRAIIPNIFLVFDMCTTFSL